MLRRSDGIGQVMISGPDDTPYSGGLFAFDIFFPPNYPSSPPKVRLMTTGGGQHRFNPNLYAGEGSREEAADKSPTLGGEMNARYMRTLEIHISMVDRHRTV